MSTVEAIKQLFLGSGVGWILWLLAACSLVSFAILFERLAFLSRRGGDLRAMSEELDGLLSKGEHTRAVAALSKQPAVAASIAAAGLKLAHLGPAAAEKAMQSATALEKARLEARLAFLGTLGNNAPFIGLFGTVIGIIQAFEELGHSAPGHGVASQSVMTGIAEALVTTAVGIAVALPAVAAFNYLQRRVAGLLSGADVLTNLVLAYLSAPRQS